MNLSSKIYVAGHKGMAGSGVLRHLKSIGYENLITRDRSELNLTNQAAVETFFANEKPEVVIMAAAKVGGIYANNIYPASFLYENLAIATNTVNAASISGTERFLFLGSSCIYPKFASQPIKESSLLTDMLEPTNEAYAIAKIAGLKLCEYYRKQYGVLFHSLMPTNLYGQGDNYHPENSHLLPALIGRFHEATVANRESVTIWGTGTPRRELMNVDDLAEAITHVLSLEDPPDLINAGTGVDHSIMEIAEIVKRVVGFEGEIKTDPSKPDGTPRKLLDVSLLKKHGWSSGIPLEKGIADTYEWYLQERESGNLRSV
ncbi:GDP-L-fucose synthase family protein [Candidatus Pelagisphaera phototrophica]|uniref:GDP-L-fucose synthase family protein n=1 Tax=Candidatus Pelagisphaera phototrophica TaxID=2684113 RepID=UPI0019F90F43|nr:GDP-L-fucose synthase [Candidatus Pelagisphaera phototrophica]QXD32534.1 GDP-L-fucose synthase [Candidatus Pelagisphaera phototrophica]